MPVRRTVGTVALLSLLSAAPLVAQYRDRHSTYDRPDSRVSVREDVDRRPERREVYRAGEPRVIVVDRARSGWRGEQWFRNGFRPVRVYLVDGRYYDRYDEARWHRGGRRVVVRQVVVYERGGRYYRPWNDERWGDRHDRWDRDYLKARREYERKHREWHRKHDREHSKWHDRHGDDHWHDWDD
jgi:hypothetical protein